MGRIAYAARAKVRNGDTLTEQDIRMLLTEPAVQYNLARGEGGGGDFPQFDTVAEFEAYFASVAEFEGTYPTVADFDGGAATPGDHLDTIGDMESSYETLGDFEDAYDTIGDYEEA